MNRDLFWVGLALTATFGGAYLNEKYNLANPELERRLVGCWAGSTGEQVALYGGVVIQVNADGTFSQTGMERLINEAKYTKFVSGSGTWKLHKDRWTLEYSESTATYLFPRARYSLKLVVSKVTSDEISAKTDYAVSMPYNLGRVAAKNGICQVQV